MEPVPERILTYAKETLAQLVAIPSVSAEGRGLEAAAQLVAEQLEALGLEAALHPTPGAPVVYATRTVPGAPTILFYNHYDVQPADPLELWETDPFTLTERDGALYGRGAVDDKGELAARIAALVWLKERYGELPFGVKFVVEGEEEVGSPHLARYVEENQARLAADACLWEAGGVDAAGRPLAYTGLKGIVALELVVRTAKFDLHSSYGAVVENPIHRLSRALASLRDADGRVLIEGFYDEVRPLTPEEEAALERIPDESPALAELFGVPAFLGGVSGTAFYRKLLAEPCVNINGFTSGYAGPGSKTVLPAEARAKLDFRLVPDQDPKRVVTLLKRHFERHGFTDVEVRVLEVGEKPARSDLTHPWVQATRAALAEVYGTEPVLYPNMPGSGPMHPFAHGLGVPVVGIGCGYPGSRVHSPNEHLRLADLERGIQAIARALERFALE
ncbi:M20/M25/M40 family metallo-hydrolase [Marinithermus hydrothermalis]|uniref:Beta-Ala-His dipeptidase n=1 Tax=Marinithermus hydrothermalis (strain DSM 14884 / JCM 11576 / T1) TaxID=869210 RepID=F2NM62_MARHT|nr:M20/M25/M40 family metallo-hydrolase [Marinithermus hydrothermalis]AEB11532.1 Beta-Ala-His dipeptidase [Marinithermus hydrothermalis DSM 14884]